MDDLLFENREILIHTLRKLDCREKVKVVKPNETMKLIEDYIEKPKKTKKIKAHVRVSVREHVKKKKYFSITRFLWRKF